MLAVLGRTPQAMATAAAAAVHSGQPVAVEQSSLSELVLGGGGPVKVAMPAGDEHLVELVPLDEGVDPDAYVLFSTPRELHDSGVSEAVALSSAPVLYAPATFAGWKALSQRRGDHAWATGVLAGFPAVGDPYPGRVHVRGVKKGLPCGAGDERAAQELCNVYSDWLPGLSPQLALEAELSSTNVLLHGPLLVGHIPRLADQRAEPDLFYRGPAFRAGIPLVLAVDNERLAIGEAMGLSLRPVVPLVHRFYGEQGMRGETLGELIETFPGFAESRAPDSFEHRYLLDDVVFGLACWEALAVGLSLATPAISAIVTVLELASGRGLRGEADRLAHLIVREVARG